MARIEIPAVVTPAAIAAISGVGQIVEKSRLENKVTQGLADNMILDNIGWFVDVIAAGAGILAHVNDFPRNGSEAAMGAGVAVLTRRAVDVIGSNVLGLQTVVTKTAAARLKAANRLGSPNANGRVPAFIPNAGVERPVLTNKRRFFSVT